MNWSRPVKLKEFVIGLVVACIVVVVALQGFGSNQSDAFSKQLYDQCVSRQKATDIANPRTIALHSFLTGAAKARTHQGMVEKKLGLLKQSHIDISTGHYWGRVLAPQVKTNPRPNCSHLG